MNPEAGRVALAYDVRRDSQGQNLLDPIGFLHALTQTCRLRPGAGALFAPVCSSFVYMTLRSEVEAYVFFWGYLLAHGALSLLIPAHSVLGRALGATIRGVISHKSYKSSYRQLLIPLPLYEGIVWAKYVLLRLVNSG